MPKDVKKKAHAELAASHITRYLQQFETRLISGGGEQVADRRFTVADLKVFMLIRWLRSGVLDHIPKDLVDRVAPQLVKHYERAANHPKVTACYQRP
ncbi:MAG: glutathione S-transferase family protein [Hyphomicrobiaceae bacterium]